MIRLSVLAVILVSAVQGGIVDADLSSELDRSLELVQLPGAVAPSVAGGYAGAREGFPMLPLLPVRVELPSGEKPVAVSCSPLWETVAADLYVPPLPAPAPLALLQVPGLTEESEEVYGSRAFWPEKAAELTGWGFSEGRPLAQLLVSPLRWNPGTGELQRLTSLQVSIETAPSFSSPLPRTDSEFSRMLIVTDQAFLVPFGQLADRRTAGGILTEVVIIDSVYASASGRDEAEMLRNYVKDYNTSYGLDYLLLGGDTGTIPFRKAYAMTCEAGFHPREDSLPCDHYFADLDGDWDANGNSTFGEIDDEVDLYPDIIVGRAPVETLSEAETFVANIVAYEDCQYEDHYQSVLFLAEILWWDPYTNSGESKDMIEEEFLPGFLDVTKLYEALGNENPTTTMAALNQGQNFINHDGHAWYSSLGVGEGYIVSDDVDAIDSGGRFGASFYSIGCWSAAFDFDAIAEHFLTNPDGGTVGYVGNSSYGWGSPGNPCYGYSDALDHLFHDLLYSDWSLTTGELLALTKEYFIPYSQWENVYRWHQYDVNLLGDPALRPYRTTPAALTVDCPDMVTVNTAHFPVQVSGGPVDGLTVCLRDQGSNWQVTELDATGYHSFQLPQPPSGSIQVTVTGPGVRRTEVNVPVSSGPQPVLAGLVIDDTGEDGMLSPGDFAHLTMTLMNQGTEELTEVSLYATLNSGPGTILEPSMIFPDLPPGSSSVGSEPVDVQMDSAAVNGDVMELELEISSARGSWTLDLSLMVCAPGLYFATYSIDDDAGGNGNGIPEPGETVDLTTSIANLGLLGAPGVEVVMTGSPPHITWLADSAFVDSIPADGTGSATFTCQLDGTIPTPSFPWLYMDLTSPDAGYASQDSMRLTVGETGVSNDVESGPAGWTHSGTGDLWNITDTGSHSPSHSWHCGDEDGYDPNMNCGLYSPELTLAPGAGLSFWASFDAAIYGSDGMYVILNDLTGGSSDTLDFIGSGGALGGGYRGTGTGWARWDYDLSGWDAGSCVQLEFRFVSDDDSDTGAGFYIDDISVEGAYSGTTSIATAPGPLQPVMGNPAPNPAGSSFSVALNIPGTGSWNLSLYDIAGRLVLTAEGESPACRALEMDTSGLSSGVYFLRLSGSAEAEGRLVILR
ncbi:MAG: C25 family cysteine peptidase [Candidatus Aegiribacteria sp.]